MFGGAQRVEHHEAAVVDPAVGVDEALAPLIPKRFADRADREIEPVRASKAPPAAQTVVQEQACSNHPRRAQRRIVRQDEPQWVDQMRRVLEQHFALGECLADQPELVMLEIAQAAVDHLAACR